MRPRTPYGAAKLAALHLVRAYRQRHGLHASAAITFNHESERRPERFLPRKVTCAAAAISLGLERELVIGDLDAVRDWSAARDVVAGLRLMAAQPEPGDYVLASGRGRTVRELVETAFAAAGVDTEGRVRVDPAFVRPPEATPPVGDPSLARERLGWEPATSFEDLIGQMVEADLRRRRAG
jgi:GDPmannose 4,6-dehydratase